MTSDQISLVRKQLYSLLQVVRKEAVPLVDAFDIPDEILNSVLGRYDGNVYTHLYEWALKAPRNKKQVRMDSIKPPNIYRIVRNFGDNILLCDCTYWVYAYIMWEWEGMAYF